MRKAGRQKAEMFRQDLQDLQDWGNSILSILLILSKKRLHGRNAD
jgi:hypothetical protein